QRSRAVLVLAVARDAGRLRVFVQQVRSGLDADRRTRSEYIDADRLSPRIFVGDRHSARFDCGGLSQSMARPADRPRVILWSFYSKRVLFPADDPLRSENRFVPTGRNPQPNRVGSDDPVAEVH